MNFDNKWILFIISSQKWFKVEELRISISPIQLIDTILLSEILSGGFLKYHSLFFQIIDLFLSLCSSFFTISSSFIRVGDWIFNENVPFNSHFIIYLMLKLWHRSLPSTKPSTCNYLKFLVDNFYAFLISQTKLPSIFNILKYGDFILTSESKALIWLPPILRAWYQCSKFREWES